MKSSIELWTDHPSLIFFFEVLDGFKTTIQNFDTYCREYMN
ncbi:hypothetical protein Q5X51_16975 [Acinetobacter baumannii]|nr:hypothetical protein [Acinetobacter baumannii]